MIEKGYMEGSYTRMKYWLQPDDYILLIDAEGNEAFFKISRDEPMGAIFIKFADASHTLANGSETGYIDLPFLAPKRQMRLYQIRPFLVQERQDNGRLPHPTNLPLDLFSYLWTGIWVKWMLPSGDKRGGTEVIQDLTVNNISQRLGGVGDGILNPAVLPYGDFPNEVLDMWTIYNVFPSVNIINNTGLTLGNDQITLPGETEPVDFNHYIGFIGRKYILVEPTTEELDKLISRELPYRGITIGGIPPLTTRI